MHIQADFVWPVFFFSVKKVCFFFPSEFLQLIGYIPFCTKSWFIWHRQWAKMSCGFKQTRPSSHATPVYTAIIFWLWSSGRNLQWELLHQDQKYLILWLLFSKETFVVKKMNHKFACLFYFITWLMRQGVGLCNIINGSQQRLKTSCYIHLLYISAFMVMLKTHCADIIACYTTSQFATCADLCFVIIYKFHISVYLRVLWNFICMLFMFIMV